MALAALALVYAAKQAIVAMTERMDVFMMVEIEGFDWIMAIGLDLEDDC